MAMHCLSPLTLILTLISLVLFGFHSSSRVASATNTSTNNDNSIGLTFPQLQGLQRSLASSLSLRTGSQDFDHCCLLAVNDSLSGINRSQVNFTSTQSEQFPCAATYNGNNSGASPVSVSYAYCNKNCPGWQRSKSSKLNQWVSPFIGFLIPSVVFCMAIPRRYVHLSWSPFAALMSSLSLSEKLVLPKKLRCHANQCVDADARFGYQILGSTSK